MSTGPIVSVAAMQRVFKSFPRLKERLGQAAGTLSVGELQMLAMGRGLMAWPNLLIAAERPEGENSVLGRMTKEEARMPTQARMRDSS